jgi:hypothetical protein
MTVLGFFGVGFIAAARSQTFVLLDARKKPKASHLGFFAAARN